MVATVVVATVVVGGAALIPNDVAPTPPVSPAGTDIWIATNGNDGTCVRGNQALPCLTMNRAFQIAQCGDEIEIGPGTYSGVQTIVESPVSASCTGSPIVMFGAEGQRPMIQHFHTALDDCHTSGADNLTLRGFDVDWGFNIHGFTNNIIVDDVHGGTFSIGGCANNTTIRNSEFGPCYSGGDPGGDCRSYWLSDGLNGKASIASGPSNILFENNVMHDYEITRADDHWECIWVGDASGTVIFRGNKFYDCVTSGIAFPDTEMEGTWIIENNWFGDAGIGYSLKWGLNGGCPPGTIITRFNSFGTGESAGDEESSGNNCSTMYFIGNIFGAGSSCGGNYSYNLYLDSGTCGGTGEQTISSLPFVNPTPESDMDYHLTGTTVADGLVPGSVTHSDASTDFDGDSRVAPRDAGADER